MPAFKKQVLEALYYIRWAPVVFTSAKTGQRVSSILEVAAQAAESNCKRVTTGVLNEVMHEALTLTPPPSVKGRRLRIYYSSQIRTNPPTIAMSCNDPTLVSDHYKQYLENKIREAFGFEGAPIRLVFRERRERG